MSQTAQYLAMRDALISCRERFRQMIEVSGPNALADQYGPWAYKQAREGFNEVDAILANPENQE